MDIRRRLHEGLARIGDAVSDARGYVRGRIGKDPAPSDSGRESPASGAPRGCSGDDRMQQELLQRIGRLELEVETQKMLSWCAVAVAAATAVFSCF